MRALLGLLALVTLIGVLLVIPAHYEAAGALILSIVLSTAVALVLVRIKPDGQFLLQLFVAALLVRVIVGTLINVFELQEFFGGDTFTYDFYGSALVKSWAGDRYYQGLVNAFVGQYASSAWGMVYMTGGIYQVIGHNMLAIQFTNAVLGAATAPVIFLIAPHFLATGKWLGFPRASWLFSHHWCFGRPWDSKTDRLCFYLS